MRLECAIMVTCTFSFVTELSMTDCAVKEGLHLAHFVVCFLDFWPIECCVFCLGQVHSVHQRSRYPRPGALYGGFLCRSSLCDSAAGCSYRVLPRLAFSRFVKVSFKAMAPDTGHSS